MIPKIVELRGHHFCDNLISASPAILDLGGHKGEFSREMADRRPGTTSLIVEADPGLFEALQTAPGGRKIWAAASGSDGEATFHASDNPEGGNIFSEEGEQFTVKTHSLETLAGMLGAETVDLMKVDIEGAELELFESASDSLLQRFKQITIEFHDFLDPSHLPRIEKIFARFESLGFMVVKCSMRYHRDVLVVSRSELAKAGIPAGMTSAICRSKAACRAVSHNVQRMFNHSPQ